MTHWEKVSAMSSTVKIRGIYATALTKLMLDAGYTIADPSVKVRKLFALGDAVSAYEILIQDRPDLQGVDLTGPPERLTQCLTFLQERLLDAILLQFSPAEEETGLVRASVEFPGFSKQVLDEIRQRVMPTINKHHRFRIIASEALEEAERTLLKYPERRKPLEDDIVRDEILMPLKVEGVVRLEHIRPSGRPMRPREGVLLKADENRLVFKRSFSKGRYDGLDVPIQEGDYGLTEIQEGAWFVKHSYYTKADRLIGHYVNINTPVELYPYGARYLDLEVDVVSRAGEQPFLIDCEKLALLCRNGCISQELERKALAVAREILLAGEH
jgi:probable ribonuclease FAU-1